jgi:hypothetical protein
MRTLARISFSLLIALACVSGCRADITFLVQEPYGAFGSINPTGHVAIYFPRVCAETPVLLRRCLPGETGVVISRYSHIAGYDWIAIPLIPYLYAVERLEDVPAEADAETVARLRNEYRRNYLTQFAPDRSEDRIPGGGWVELVGASYNRKIYGFQIGTTEDQDDNLIARLNSRKNRSHFNLFLNNCADFSRRILNFYYPGSAHPNYVGDAGITTPKQISKCLVKYHQQHPEIRLSTFFIPQVPGSRRPSHKLDGVFEGFVKSKKYMVPLAVFHPWAAGAVFVGYLTGGHFNVAYYAETKYDLRELVAGEMVYSRHPAPEQQASFVQH